MVPNGCPGAGDRMNALVDLWRCRRPHDTAEVCGCVLHHAGQAERHLSPQGDPSRWALTRTWCLFDPDYKGTITLETNPTGVEYNVFEGLEQIGRSCTVLLRGSVVVENGRYLGEVTEVVADGITYQGCTSGNGKFIPGKPYGLGYDLLKR